MKHLEFEVKLKVTIEVEDDADSQEVFERMQEHFAESFEHWDTLPGNDEGMGVDIVCADNWEEVD